MILKIGVILELVEKFVSWYRIFLLQEVSPDYELRTANLMYISDQMSVRKEFFDSVVSAFRAATKVLQVKAYYIAVFESNLLAKTQHKYI